MLSPIMGFEVTKPLVKEMLEEDSSLQTIANQYTLDEIWEMLEDKASITSEDMLFESLMDVMYATRPKGWLSQLYVICKSRRRAIAVRELIN